LVPLVLLALLALLALVVALVLVVALLPLLDLILEPLRSQSNDPRNVGVTGVIEAEFALLRLHLHHLVSVFLFFVRSRRSQQRYRR
jgi:hypothetical protein